MRRDWVYYIDLRLLWKMAASGKENMPKGTAGGDSQKQTCEIAQRRFAAAYGNIDVSVRDSLIFRFRTFHFLSRAYTLGRRTQRTAAFRFSASFDIHEQRITNISSVSFRLIIYLYRNNTSVGRNFNDSASARPRFILDGGASRIYPGSCTPPRKAQRRIIIITQRWPVAHPICILHRRRSLVMAELSVSQDEFTSTFGTQIGL